MWSYTYNLSQMTQLTLDLQQDLVDIIDRLVREDGKCNNDDFGRRRAIRRLLYEYDDRSRRAARGTPNPTSASKTPRPPLRA